MPLLWEAVPYPDMKAGLAQHDPVAFAISLIFWVPWFVGLVMICKGLVKIPRGLYESSAERKRNIGIHEAVASAMQMQRNALNVSGIENSVNASNTINHYAQSPDKDWKVTAGLWLAITGAAGESLCRVPESAFQKAVQRVSRSLRTALYPAAVLSTRSGGGEEQKSGPVLDIE